MVSILHTWQFGNTEIADVDIKSNSGELELGLTQNITVTFM